MEQGPNLEIHGSKGTFLAFQSTDTVAIGRRVGAHDHDDSEVAQRVDSRADLRR